ncbi:MAG: PrsW family glutamic-type intramembrane protease [Polyangiaceae bacterium]
MGLDRLLYRADGRPRLLLPALVAFGLTVAAGFAVVSLARRPPTDVERAATLSRSEKHGAAEALYVRLLAKEPTVPLLLALVDNHERGLAGEAKKRLSGEERSGLPDATDRVMSDDELERVLSALPADLSLVARFVESSDGAADADVRASIEAGARRVPPVPWYNHLLAEDALHRGDDPAAADYYEREGLFFAARHDDVDEAFDIWMNAEEWDRVRQRLADPRVWAAAGPETKARFATHEQDWRGAARWTAAGYKDRLAAWTLAMSGVSALAWGLFCARFGRIGERPLRRSLFFLAAFVLGVLSVGPTVLLIMIEEAKLKLVETGDAARDILFFVFGVALREEASKLLLFAALLPALRRWGDKLDVLVCGAFVGLGFAAEENLGYLAGGDLHESLGRFLTANFFHMALTGTLAASLYDFVTDPERNASQFMTTSLMIVGLHGAYDFLISHSEYGGSYLSMVVFVFLTQLFLRSLASWRPKVDRGLSPLHAFVLAAAVVTGVSAVRASTMVGPIDAALVMGEGLAGEAVIMVIFVRTLRSL